MAAPKGNSYALGNNGGRPPHFESPELLHLECQAYFEKCEADRIKTTITGLALYLGFCSRSSLEDYCKKEEFSYIIKRAKLAVENGYEQSGQAFDIFALKNMGWVDKQEIDQTNRGGVDIRVVYEDDNKTETPPSGTETGTE